MTRARRVRYSNPMVTSGIPAAQVVWTYDDYRKIPDDGNRYEVIDGDLYVTPAPSILHQTVSKRIKLELMLQLEQPGLGLRSTGPERTEPKERLADALAAAFWAPRRRRQLLARIKDEVAALALRRLHLELSLVTLSNVLEVTKDVLNLQAEGLTEVTRAVRR